MSENLRVVKEWVLLVLAKPFGLETPFSFDSRWSATGGRYVSINVDNETVMILLSVFKLFHVRICNRSESEPIYFHQIIYNSPSKLTKHIVTSLWLRE
jgi:hypothetical protein